LGRVACRQNTLAYFESLPILKRVLQHRHLVNGTLEDFVDGRRVAESDEAEAAGPSCCRILHDHDFGEFAKGREVFSDRLRRCLPRQATDEHLSWVVGNVIARKF